MWPRGRVRKKSKVPYSKHIPVNTHRASQLLTKALISIRDLLLPHNCLKTTMILMMGLMLRATMSCCNWRPAMSWVHQPGCIWCCHLTSAPDWWCNIIWLMIHRGSLSLSVCLTHSLSYWCSLCSMMFFPWRAQTLVLLGNSHCFFSLSQGFKNAELSTQSVQSNSHIATWMWLSIMAKKVTELYSVAKNLWGKKRDRSSELAFPSLVFPSVYWHLHWFYNNILYFMYHT